ncbi:MAG: hypothetical protein H7144_04685 [Burkholderiales bacterium]|nr:hypothetical protein [Phycisphaerae bacterium]
MSRVSAFPPSMMLHRAVSRARLRLTVARLCDALLIGGLISAGIAAPILFLSPLQPLERLLPWFALGIACVSVLHVIFRPVSDATAASAMDRVNHSADLFSTALQIAPDGDAWTHTVQSLADAACERATLPPWLGKYSPRSHAAAWTGVIGTLLLANLARSPAAADDKPNLIRPVQNHAYSLAGAPRVDPQSSSQNSSDALPHRREEDSKVRSSDANSNISHGQTPQPGVGRADSGTETRYQFSSSRRRPRDSVGTGSEGHASTGGSGMADTIPGRDDKMPPHNTALVDTPPVFPPAPWALDGWRKQRDEPAHRTTGNGGVDEYREIITDYFDR